jgi:dihydrofolate synthase / folylpolyglutamate synthase
MFQRTGPAAYKNSLDNILKLDNFYGNPHRYFKTIHVAGTNGKGSVSHMLAAVFQMAGYKTGLYTSPHLKDFRERIRINGQMIGQDDVIAWVERYKDSPISKEIDPSFFELTVAMAFDFFSANNVDVAVIEVGLGGRLDSTNIITPEVSIITNIGLDHTALLGDSLEKIAAEKAGIIKPGIPVVIGINQSEIKKVFENKSKLVKAPLFFAERNYIVKYLLSDVYDSQIFSVINNGEEIYADLKVDLGGRYQLKNLPAVLQTLDIVQSKGWNITKENILSSLSKVKILTGIRGRWQILGKNPLIVADAAHNADGIAEVIKQIRQTSYKNLHIIVGLVSDKDPLPIMKLLPADANYYFTKAAIPRALDERELARCAEITGLKGETYPSVKKAFWSSRARAGKDDFIFVGGSTFVVAEIL